MLIGPPLLEKRVLSCDAYVGIDWSGASGRRYRGIAVAQCMPGRGAPELVTTPDGWWSRSAVLDWLCAEQATGKRLLVGFDLAFALPPPFAPPPRIWADVDAHCTADADLLGSRYANDDPRFWKSGRRPAGWLDHPRPAERACAIARLGYPQTPLKLIGARQVGRGALAGMRLLHRLRLAQPDGWHIWPFDGLPDATRSVCVEMYPRLFIRRTIGSHAKLRTHHELAAALHALDSDATAPGDVDDHEADALVSAAGLRALAGDASVWNAGLGQPYGWIFGVPSLPADT